MKFHRLGLGMFLVGMIAASARAEVTTNPPLRVMTYNLRYASATGPNAWPQRRPLMRELLTNTAPDLIGTQEGLHGQLQDIASDLPDYVWTGVGRDDGKTKGEFMAVFYRKARLEALSTNHFWLSDTPEVPGSTTWGNKNRRMVTWLKFHDRLSGNEFFLFNTHFDHEVVLARDNSAKLIRQRIAALNPKLPVLLIGDFNAGAGRTKAFDLLTEGGFLADTWLTARERINDGVDSFNGFAPIAHTGERIDWVLARGGVSAERAEILTFSRENQYPSDHFPVMVSLTLKGNPSNGSRSSD